APAAPWVDCATGRAALEEDAQPMLAIDAAQAPPRSPKLSTIDSVSAGRLLAVRVETWSGTEARQRFVWTIDAGPLPATILATPSSTSATVLALVEPAEPDRAP